MTHANQPNTTEKVTLCDGCEFCEDDAPEVVTRGPGCCHFPGVKPPDPANSVTMHDRYGTSHTLRIAEIQPEYNLIQINARREACGSLVSVDVDRDEFIAAVEAVIGRVIRDGA